MAKTIDAARVVAKWTANAGAASPAYAEGVNNPSEDWQRATLAASENWKMGVTKAAADGRFNKGVQRVSTEQQIQSSVQKGTARYSQGIALAGPDYAKGIEPVLAVINSTVLPARKPKGDPANIQRVAALAAAQHAAKLRR